MLGFNSGVKRNELVTSVGKQVEVGLVSSWEHSWTEKGEESSMLGLTKVR